MLTVQPSKTAFGQKRRLTQEEIEELKEQREYLKNRRELEDQRDEFLELANDKELKIPKSAKKLLDGGAIVTTGLLGGMATGWGTKKTIQGYSKLNKTSQMIALKKHANATFDFIKTSSKTVKKQFIESDAYKMPANALKKQKEKFAKTKFGKPITEFFDSLFGGIKEIFKELKTDIKQIIRKIKGLDKAKVEKITVNTVGTSGGIATSVNAIKEKQEAGDEE